MMPQKNVAPEATEATSKMVGRTKGSVTRWSDLPRALVHVGIQLPERVTAPAVVLVCPAARCGHLHAHRVGDLDALAAGHVVRACPITGQRYVLVDCGWEVRRG